MDFLALARSSMLAGKCRASPIIRIEFGGLYFLCYKSYIKCIKRGCKAGDAMLTASTCVFTVATSGSLHRMQGMTSSLSGADQRVLHSFSLAPARAISFPVSTSKHNMQYSGPNN